MGDTSDLRGRLNETLLSVGAWGGTAAAAALATADHASASQVLIAAGLSGLAAAADKLPALHKAWTMRNWLRVLFGFSKPKETEIEAERALNAAMLNSDGQAVLFDVLHKMNDATDPSALIPIGRLLREYVDGARPIDGFFRGVVRTLLDVTGTEMASLRIIFRAIRDSRNKSQFIDMHVYRPGADHFDFSEAGGDHLRIPIRPQSLPNDYEYEEVDNPSGGSRRLFHFLLSYGLAIDPSMMGSAPAIAMDRKIAARLLALLED